MREIITDWTVPGAGGGLTVMYFEDTPLVADQMTALNALWDDMAEWISNDTSWSVRSEGRELDETTGVLTGFWAEGAPLTGSGDGASDVVPNATQALVRWRTDSVVGGRRIQGRTFVPGIADLAIDPNGHLATGAQGTLFNAAETFVVAGVGFGVWHRPTDGAGGSHHIANSTAVWSEFAVQRRRRQ